MAEMPNIAYIPKIEWAEFSENPTETNKKVVFSVKVIEESVILMPEIWYSGEIYAGEVI